MNQLPKFSTYVPHASANYGLNCLCFEVEGREFYFSYKTFVAFRGRDGWLRVRRNDWGVTTGRHLNAIDGGNKASRLSDVDFEAAYRAEMGQE